MGVLYRKVQFYKLEIFNKRENKYENVDTFKEIFSDIIKIHANDNNSMILKGGDDQVTLDVISDDVYLFERIGKLKDINQIHIRHRKSLTTRQIEVEDEEGIEIYTYFILNYDTGIISIICSRSAPNIQVIKHFFAKKEYLYSAEVNMIPNPDVINMLKKIERFSGLEVRIARPSVEVLGKEGLDVGKRKLANLINLPSNKLTITLSGGDEHLQKGNYKELREVIEDIFEIKDGKIERLELRARFEEGSRTEPINLLEEYFVRQIVLKTEHGDTEIPITQIRTELILIYEKLESSLIKYIPEPEVA